MDEIIRTIIQKKGASLENGDIREIKSSNVLVVATKWYDFFRLVIQNYQCTDDIISNLNDRELSVWFLLSGSNVMCVYIYLFPSL